MHSSSMCTKVSSSAGISSSSRFVAVVRKKSILLIFGLKDQNIHKVV